ncbi:MAG TPA: SufD family Fe-S cluster assembly protein, partial [Bacteroidales bacterium]|nr:SufD family Fe-S cluster assembly protein [Bacteroidales bacterium]
MNIDINNKKTLEEKLIALFNEKENILPGYNNPEIRQLRKSAIQHFIKYGFPSNNIEEWRTTDVSKIAEIDYKIPINPPDNINDIENLFICDVPNLDTLLFTIINGWFTYKQKPNLIMPDGIIVSSLAYAINNYTDIIQKHLGKYALINENGLISINTAFAQDGIFIYIPDNISLKKPIQIVSIVNTDDNILIQPRNLIVIGKNSTATIIHCDHSLKHQISFVNSITEVFLDEGSQLDHYKVQNKDEKSKLITSIYFNQQKNSILLSNTFTLNGGLIRNNIKAILNGTNCHTELKGLYLADKQQHIDNNIFVDHIEPNSKSNQIYKGIIDDSAHGIYNGYIRVNQKAQQTEAYQSNKNILLSSKATAFSKPHLEIYADNV